MVKYKLNVQILIIFITFNHQNAVSRPNEKVYLYYSYDIFLNHKSLLHLIVFIITKNVWCLGRWSWVTLIIFCLCSLSLSLSLYMCEWVTLGEKLYSKKFGLLCVFFFTLFTQEHKIHLYNSNVCHQWLVSEISGSIHDVMMHTWIAIRFLKKYFMKRWLL